MHGPRPYILSGLAAILLAATTPTFTIVAVASRAFAAYYAIQAVLAMRTSTTRAHQTGYGALAVVMTASHSSPRLRGEHPWILLLREVVGKRGWPVRNAIHSKRTTSGPAVLGVRWPGLLTLRCHCATETETSNAARSARYTSRAYSMPRPSAS